MLLLDKLKVLTKKSIIEGLKEGAIISYFTIYGKVYLYHDNIKVGAIRFDTFLTLRSELNLKQLKNTISYISG